MLTNNCNKREVKNAFHAIIIIANHGNVGRDPSVLVRRVATERLEILCSCPCSYRHRIGKAMHGLNFRELEFWSATGKYNHFNCMYESDVSYIAIHWTKNLVDQIY